MISGSAISPFDTSIHTNSTNNTNQQTSEISTQQTSLTLTSQSTKPLIPQIIANTNKSGNNIKFKLVLLGDASTGKTSLINRFLYDSFEPYYAVTIGIDFFSIRVENEIGKPIHLQIWDTAGQERYRSLVPSYLRDSDCAILVFDVSNRSSFEALHNWLDNISRDRGEDAWIILAANKCDIIERTVSCDEIQAFARIRNIQCFETSALTNVGVHDMMKVIVNQFPERSPPNETMNSNQIIDVQVSSISANTSSQSNCSC